MKSGSYLSEARTYGLVLAALLGLTLLTVAVSGFHFQSEVLNVSVALGIATVKASLVALFFMHLRHDRPMNALIFVVGLAFLGVFLMLSLIDVETRLPVQPSKTATPVIRNPA